MKRRIAIDHPEVVLLTRNVTSGILISDPSGVGLLWHIYRREAVEDKLQKCSIQGPAS